MPHLPEAQRSPRPEPGVADRRPPASEQATAWHRRPIWWREITLIAIVYGAYTITRGATNSSVGNADDFGRALLEWERTWHLAPEHGLNELLWRLPVLAVAASYFYATLHYVLTPAVLIWLYRRRPHRYRAARTTLLLATVLGLAGFVLLPTTPPRLLPGEDFHDTLATVSDWGWWGSEASAPRGLGSLTNQYAAMPSLHVGWALWTGWLLARHARRRSIRTAGALYPALTTVVVMATANHYLLDAAGGVIDVALAAGLVAVVAPLVISTITRPRTGPATPAGLTTAAGLPTGLALMTPVALMTPTALMSLTAGFAAPQATSASPAGQAPAARTGCRRRDARREAKRRPSREQATDDLDCRRSPTPRGS
jgi:hypothetical protein